MEEEEPLVSGSRDVEPHAYTHTYLVAAPVVARRAAVAAACGVGQWARTPQLPDGTGRAGRTGEPSRERRGTVVPALSSSERAGGTASVARAPVPTLAPASPRLRPCPTACGEEGGAHGPSVHTAREGRGGCAALSARAPLQTTTNSSSGPLVDLSRVGPHGLVTHRFAYRGGCAGPTTRSVLSPHMYAPPTSERAGAKTRTSEDERSLEGAGAATQRRIITSAGSPERPGAAGVDDARCAC